MKCLQFGNAVFPYNPSLLRVTMQQNTAVHALPLYGERWDSMGRALTLVEGEGEFLGSTASQMLELLTRALENQTSALLCLPDRRPFRARLTYLQLTGYGGEDHYRFAFRFLEDNSASQSISYGSYIPYSIV